MTDEFIASLRNDWRDQPDLPPVVLKRAKRGRALSWAMLAFEIGSMVFGFGFGVWFALAALATGRLVLLLAAIVLVAMTPAFGLATWLVRRDALKWEEETPAGVLRARRRQLEATLRMLWLGWWAGGLLAVFIAALWALEIGGLMAERSFLITYTAISAILFAVIAIWIVIRQGRVADERDACDRMLAELGEG